jgi:RND superfamily putative drug exporter
MVFDRLGSFIVRRYKLVLVAWVLILVACTPLIMRVGEVTTAQQETGGGAPTESDKAQDIVDKQFPRAISNSTMLIVVVNRDVTDVGARDMLLELERRVRSNPDIKFLEPGTPGAFPKDFVSVYTIERFVLIQAVDGMNTGMHQMAGTVSLVWGIPAQYLGVYAATMGNDTEAERQVNATIQATASQDPATGAMLSGHFSLFRMNWQANAANMTLLADPQLRAEVSARAAVQAFVMGPGIPAAQAGLMLAAASTFNITTFTNPLMVQGFAVGAIAQSANITNLTFLNGVYGLGDLSRQPAADRSAAAAAFVDGTVLPNGTIDTYPVGLPADLWGSFISPDRKVTIVTLAFTKKDEWVDANGTRPNYENVVEVRKILDELRKEHAESHIKTYVSGGAAISKDIMETMGNDFALIEFVTVPMLIILMGLFFRSVLTPIVPLGAVGIAMGLSQAAIFIIGTLVAPVDTYTTTMLFSVLMGVGTDYSIFIVARFREERIKGAERDEAVKTSVTWAGESIATSGATVMIAFLSLCIASFEMVKVMGLVMGVAILAALLIALTLVPSLLMLAGNGIFWPNNKERFKRYAQLVLARRKEGQHGYFYKAASFSVKHSKLIVALAVLVSIPTSYIYFTAETSFDFIGTMPKVESTRGMDAMTAGFGAGRIMPSYAVMVFREPVFTADGNFSPAALRSMEEVSAALARQNVVHEVDGPTRPYGIAVDFSNPANLSQNDRAKMREFVGLDNRTVRLSIVMAAAPTSQEAVNSVPSLRTAARDAAKGNGVQNVYLGGATPGSYDAKTNLDREFNQMQIIVVIGIFIVLVIVLGSLLLPAFAILSIGMSISWSFAATFLIFHEWLGVPILFLVPLILFIVLMGLGMDYNIFILTRIREEVHKGKSDEEAIVTAVDWTGGIITALAVIMGGAIGVLVLSSAKMLAEYGFAISFAVLLDAMVVRTYIVPAVMKLLGKWNWYAPGPLQRERRETKKAAVDAKKDG